MCDSQTLALARWVSRSPAEASHGRRLGRIAGAGLVLLVVAGSCGDGTTVRLVLAPDTELNSVGEVLAQVGRLQITVDREGGIGGVDQPGPTSGGGEAVDSDGDGELEVVFAATAAGDADALPVLEFGLPHNAGANLGFRILGFAADAELILSNAIALGAASATCDGGETCRVGTPFNLLARARAPRVIWVAPPDGTMDVPKNLAYISVVFSNQVVESSVAANVELVGDAGHRPATTLEVKEVIYGVPPDLQQQRSMLRLVLDEELVDLHYSLSVGPGIDGTNGLAFDQRHDIAGEDGYVSGFGNQADALGCPNGYLWDQEYSGCVALATCASTCADGYVCDQSVQQCVEDCRPFAGCIDPARSCSQASGLCGP